MTKVINAPITIIILGLLFTGCGAEQPDTVGLKDGALQECPESPNCIQSYSSTDEDHFMEPLKMVESDLAKTKDRILAVVGDMKRTEVISEEGNYIHVTYTTAVFRFIDDVEFLIDEENGLVHFRSASRVGYSDLGVNEKRMTEFSELYSAFEN